MTVNYKIIDFDEATAQITIRVANFAPILVDLPIDDEGNLPTGDALAQYLSGFIPTWHFERQERLANGISNSSAIAQLVEPESITSLTSEQIANSVRTERDLFLQSSDWTQTLDAPLSQVEKEAWAAYRQALRDVPAQAGFPTIIQWPMSPNAEPR